jgi:hypothetical protein
VRSFAIASAGRNAGADPRRDCAQDTAAKPAAGAIRSLDVRAYLDTKTLADSKGGKGWRKEDPDVSFAASAARVARHPREGQAD